MNESPSVAGSGGGDSLRPMRALVVVHDPGSLPTMVGERLRHHGFELVEFPIGASVDDAESHVPFPDPSEFDLVVPMGAVWSVYDDDTIGSWIGRELEFLRACDATGTPVFGVCFGFQALASALGGSTVPAEVPQVGWFEIESAVPEIIANGPWMEWHYDRSEVPPDAEILATDDTCVQAFRLRRNLGVQFHPEVDRAHVELWLEMGGHAELENLGLRSVELIEATERNAKLARPNTFALVDWFLAEVAGFELETIDVDHASKGTTSA